MMFKSKRENGQTIVLIVVMIFGLLALSALVVDGGNAYLSRRQAQTAADAGALAGVQEKCINGKDDTQTGNTIQKYVEAENDSTLEQWYIDSVTDYLVVEVSREHRNFFAQILGQPTTRVEAKAAAGCLSPGAGTGVLPIAWACHKPTLEEQTWSESEECVYKALENSELQLLLHGPYLNDVPGPVVVDGVTYDAPFDFMSGYLPEIYVIMNSSDLPTDLNGICQSQGGYMDCDINDDGKDDFQGSGDVSWLDLDGGGGSVDPNWITEGFTDGTLSPHMWIPSQTGVTTNIFINAITQKIGEVVLVPVFNTFCNGHPLNEPVEPGCVEAAHLVLGDPQPPLTEIEVPTSASSPIYYHLAGFAAFFVTCVDQPSVGNCPGHDAAVDQGIFPANTKTVEGYFILGYPMELGSGNAGVDLGVYVLSLVE
jgi:hypothetical protein